MKAYSDGYELFRKVASEGAVGPLSGSSVGQRRQRREASMHKTITMRMRRETHL